MEQTEIPKLVDWKDFRKHGHELVDYIADYLENIEKQKVQHSVQPGYLRDLLPKNAPENAEDFHLIMDDFSKFIIPGMNNWQHPNFFAFFPANSSPPSFFADMLTKMFSSLTFNWNTSPACTELDQIIMDWLCQALGLPDFYLSKYDGGGVIHGSACETTLVSVLAARDKTLKDKGCSIDKLRFYDSDQSHSSVKKGLMIAGIKDSQIHVISTDYHNLKANVNEFKDVVLKDIADGFYPCHCSFNIGSTAGGAFDDLTEIGKIAKNHDIWFHVDGAYAGSALICPEFRYIAKGLEYSDSFVMNPHKWLLTNFPFTAAFFRNRKYILDSLSINPEYLKSKEHDNGLVYDYRDWQISLGRSFRSLKLWFVLRYYGITGLQQHIRYHIQLANMFYDKIKDDKHFEIVVPPFLSLICFRLNADNKKNEDYYNEINANPNYQLTHCFLHEKYTIRLVVGSPQTEKSNIEEVYNFIKTTSDKYF